MRFNSAGLKILIVFFCALPDMGCIKKEKAQQKVQTAGAMRNVMQKGDLRNTIAIDTITNKDHLFGLGPLEGLTGETLIVDGYGYLSKVVSDSTLEVNESLDFKSPFYVYMNVNEWNSVPLPDSVESMPQIEVFLDKFSKEVGEPFAFRIMGFIETATIHIVNLPAGSEIHSPQDAHQGQINYQLSSEPVEVVGFFSRKHKSIFTHHDSYTHMHLITDDKTKMGHLDAIKLQQGLAQLWVSF